MSVDEAQSVLPAFLVLLHPALGEAIADIINHADSVVMVQWKARKTHKKDHITIITTIIITIRDMQMKTAQTILAMRSYSCIHRYKNIQ
jgi:hypothetical protein